MSSRVETREFGIDPLQADSDENGLGDGEELEIFGADPLTSDLDADAMGFDGRDAFDHLLDQTVAILPDTSVETRLVSPAAKHAMPISLGYDRMRLLRRYLFPCLKKGATGAVHSRRAM